MGIEKEIELAWAAGLFDGEGCTSVSNGRQLFMRISQKTATVLTRFKTALGAGEVYPCNTQEGFMFGIGDAYQVEDALKLLWPYLSKPKKIQAITAMKKFNSRPWFTSSWVLQQRVSVLVSLVGVGPLNQAYCRVQLGANDD